MKYVFWIIWRIWFALWSSIVTVLLSPVFLIFLIKDNWYYLVIKTAKVWSVLILAGMGFTIKHIGDYEFPEEKNLIYIANHTSVFDIMLMLLICKKPIVFVGKAELAKLPVFGYLYRKTCVLVDRQSLSSRKAVFEEVSIKVNQGKSICIFPEGLVPEDESVVLSPFKIGAFKLAKDHELDLAPVALLNLKQHYSYTFFSGKPGVLKYKKLPIIPWSSQESPNDLRKEAYDLIVKELKI